MERKMIFDPEAYTITIRKEIIDGENCFVGKVAEIPTISAYEDSYQEAREIVLDAITVFKEMADEERSNFPPPFPRITSEYNGRITVRLTKSLHAKVAYIADLEGVSINQYILSAVALVTGEKSVGYTDLNKNIHPHNLTDQGGFWKSLGYGREFMSPEGSSKDLIQSRISSGYINSLKIFTKDNIPLPYAA